MAALSIWDKRALNDLDITDLGTPDTVRFNVLTFVVNEEYDRAAHYLKDFLERESVYPNFKERVERYVMHSIDLVYAIKNKRNFPGMSLLGKSKQNELREKYRDHFFELKSVMKKIENCQEELRLNDIKSTTMIVRSFWLATMAVFVSAFAIEMFQGLGLTFIVVIEEYVNKFIDYLFTFIK